MCGNCDEDTSKLDPSMPESNTYVSPEEVLQIHNDTMNELERRKLEIWEYYENELKESKPQELHKIEERFQYN